MEENENINPEENDNSQGNEDQIEAFKSFISEQVKEAISANLPDPTKPDDNIPKPDDPNNQLREVIDPLYRPELDGIALGVKAAEDKVDFYLDADEDKAAYRDQIEDLFTKQVQAGRPVSRNDIYAHLKGKELIENRDKVVDAEIERRKAAEEKANANIDWGVGSFDRARNDPDWANLDKLESSEEVAKKMEGIVF